MKYQFVIFALVFFFLSHAQTQTAGKEKKETTEKKNQPQKNQRSFTGLQVIMQKNSMAGKPQMVRSMMVRNLQPPAINYH